MHSLFEEQYNDLFGANDNIAERIRILGDKVPTTFDIFSDATSIKGGNKNASASDMIKDLAKSHALMIDSLKKVLKVAQYANDEVTMGFVVDRIGTHEKAIWFLNSSI